VQTGEMFEITAGGARSLHHFPAGLLRNTGINLTR
jgi:Xaa-Pro dipeptidase